MPGMTGKEQMGRRFQNELPYSGKNYHLPYINPSEGDTLPNAPLDRPQLYDRRDGIKLNEFYEQMMRLIYSGTTDIPKMEEAIGAALPENEQAFNFGPPIKINETAIPRVALFDLAALQQGRSGTEMSFHDVMAMPLNAGQAPDTVQQVAQMLGDDRFLLGAWRPPGGYGAGVEDMLREVAGRRVRLADGPNPVSRMAFI